MAVINVNLEDIQIRRNTASNWTSNNPILLDGELGYESDTNQLKIGNGVDDWSTRPYLTGSGGGGGLTQEEIEDLINAVVNVDTNLTKSYSDLNGIITIGLSSTIVNKLLNLPENQAAINSDIESRTLANDAKISNVDHPLVETAVPAGAVFTDTLYDDTAIQAEVDLNTAKVSYPGPQDISGKQDNIILTTTGNSGAATFNANVLNIPQYTGVGGTTNNYNNTYIDYGGTSLVGVIDGVNTTFTVSESEYRGTSLVVFIEGIAHYSGVGLTETNPGTGVFTMDTAPEANTQMAAKYEVGTLSAGTVQSIVAGTNITIDDTDPANPIVNSTGGGGGGFSETAEPLVPTAQNTLPNLAQAPADVTVVRIVVNGVTIDNFANSGISVSGAGAITVNSGNLGYNIETTDRIIAYYTV